MKQVRAFAEMSKADVIKWLQSQAMPAHIKTAVMLGVSIVKEADWVKYRNIFIETIQALRETERGRKVLFDLGLGQAEPKPEPG